MKVAIAQHTAFSGADCQNKPKDHEPVIFDPLIQEPTTAAAFEIGANSWPGSKMTDFEAMIFTCLTQADKLPNLKLVIDNFAQFLGTFTGSWYASDVVRLTNYAEKRPTEVYYWACVAKYLDITIQDFEENFLDKFPNEVEKLREIYNHARRTVGNLMISARMKVD